MNQRFCVLGLDPSLAGLQSRRLMVLLVRDCAPARSSNYRAECHRHYRWTIRLSQATACPQPRLRAYENAKVSCSVLSSSSLPESRSKSETLLSYSESRKGTTVSTSICSPGSSSSSSFGSSSSSLSEELNKGKTRSIWRA